VLSICGFQVGDEKYFATAPNQDSTAPRPHNAARTAATDTGHHEKVCCFRSTTFSSSIQCIHSPEANSCRSINFVRGDFLCLQGHVGGLIVNLLE